MKKISNSYIILKWKIYKVIFWSFVLGAIFDYYGTGHKNKVVFCKEYILVRVIFGPKGSDIGGQRLGKKLIFTFKTYFLLAF